MAIHPRHRGQLREVLTFGLIWLIFGLIYVFLEYGLMGRLNIYPSTGNSYSFKGSFFIVSIGSFLMGSIQGSIEIFWLRNYLEHFALWRKLLFKSIFYTILVILFVIGLTLVTNAIILEQSLFSQVVIQSLWGFMSKISFWIIILYIGCILDIALFYSEINAHLGNKAIENYLGKYHRPIQERRIFMFLDMKSSTTVAEKIGHELYFELLKTYYADMTNAVLETSGDIYQYVGDEIVVTWKEQQGVKNNNCINCFIKISKAIAKNKNQYLERFGLIPEFKAGFHVGEVTAGEIGIIKKDIIYTGDVLNTTARIQAECNHYNAKTLISEELFEKLSPQAEFECSEVDKLQLKGKQEFVQLYKIVYV